MAFTRFALLACEKAIDKLLDVGDLGLAVYDSLLAFEFFATQSLESRVVAAMFRHFAR